MLREGPIERVAFEQRSEGGEKGAMEVSGRRTCQAEGIACAKALGQDQAL